MCQNEARLLLPLNINSVSNFIMLRLYICLTNSFKFNDSDDGVIKQKDF